jgi:MtN3 and saliva related transmembrane protein
MKSVELLFGYLGSIFAALIFFPQVLTSYKTKRTKDLSWMGIIIGMLNGISWVVYGLLKGDPFIWVTNSILFIGAFFLMILKRMHG